MQGIQNLLPKWVVSRWVYGWGNDRICDMCNTCCHSSNNMTCHVQMPVINESHKHIYIYPSWESTTSLPRSRMTFDRVKVWKHSTKVHISQTWLFANQLSSLKLLPLQVDEPLKNLPFSLHVFSSEYWSSLVDPDPRTLKFQRNIRAKHLLIRHANPSGPTSETHLTLKDDCARTWRSSNAPGNQTNERDLCFWTWDENFMEQPAVFDDRLGNQWKPTQKENNQKKKTEGKSSGKCFMKHSWGSPTKLPQYLDSGSYKYKGTIHNSYTSFANQKEPQGRQRAVAPLRLGLK